MKTIRLLAGVIEESNRRGGSRLGNIEMERITLKRYVFLFPRR